MHISGYILMMYPEISYGDGRARSFAAACGRGGEEREMKMKQMRRILAAVLAASLISACAPAWAEEAADAETEESAENTGDSENEGEAAETPSDEEASIPQLNWQALVDGADEKLEARLLKGSFVGIDDVGMQMWLPSSFIRTDLKDEDRDLGFIDYFEKEDKSAAAGVMYADTEGLTLSEYKNFLTEMGGIKDVEDLTVNGIRAIRYELEGTDSVCLALITGAGYSLEFTYGPISDEKSNTTAKLIMASIQSGGQTPAMPAGAQQEPDESGEDGGSEE